MKLISMVDFVLLQNKENRAAYKTLHIINIYANFLNQPLELGMFICEVPEPEIQGGYSNDGDFIGGYFDEWVKSYGEAKERVLFDGFEFVRELKNEINLDIKYYRFKFNGDFFNLTFGKTIEDLVKYNLTLTPNVIKKLGL